MSRVAPTLQAFFTERLTKQRRVSPRTVASYRDTFRLLLRFVQERSGKEPSMIEWDDLDEPVVASFLDYLELGRGNSVRTRNLRLTAIRSLFRYAAFRHPEHSAVIARVLSIPPKRFERRTITYLTPEEVESLVGAPDVARWEGRRDRTLLLVMAQTGLRVSEALGLNCSDVVLGVGAHVRCEGKGRRERAVPLTEAARDALADWLKERTGQPDEPVFPTRTGRRLSRDAVERRMEVHGRLAAERCPSLRSKNLHPHVLRHSCAMALLQSGVDTTVIALWLGHADPRSTNAYLHADLTMKERALAMVTPISVPPGRFRPQDELIAFLESL